MKGIYLYATESSLDVLLDSRQKLILIGSDFGYGNFGDVVQHLGAVSVARECERYAIVSVMAANAIGRSSLPAWAIGVYGVDAIVYVAEYPLILEGASPDLKLVGGIRNVSVVWLYGGGFLNDFWGEYMLSAARYFLDLAPQAHYIVSGQQITPPFQSAVIDHIKSYSPRLFGVRDGLSQQALRESGYDARYSFDDASEMLLDLAGRVGLGRGEGLLLHLNSSGYTANSSLQRGIGCELKKIHSAGLGARGVTVAQAFRDAREEVRDSTETIKQLDGGFPFPDIRVVDLVGLALGDRTGMHPWGITASVGYSCSYHVALWLQLAGIPCWLRSSNAFYEGKARALQVTQDIDAFLREPRLADHRLNLERRAEWIATLRSELENAVEQVNLCRLPDFAGGPAPWPFFFKGVPTLEDRLREADGEIGRQYVRVEAMQSELNARCREISELEGRAKLLEQRLADADGEIHRRGCSVAHLQAELEATRLDLLAASERIEALGGQVAHAREEAVCVSAENQRLSDRVLALGSQLAEVGDDAHRQRARVDFLARENQHLSEQVDSLRSRAEVAESLLARVVASRSWQVTRPLRALVRFLKTGRFDARGEVGVLGLVRRVMFLLRPKH